MGGIIAALIGIALVIGSIMARRYMRKQAVALQAKADETKGKAAATPSGTISHANLTKSANQQAAEARAARWIARACILGVLIGLAFLVPTSLVVVPTRNVAVTDAFGRPTSTLNNGPSLTWPWETVTVYDATVQTLDMSGDGSDGKPAQQVRIMNGTATATMHVTVEWRIDPEADIQGLHKDWRNFESIEGRVVKPRLSASLNTVFETYDPLVALRETEGKPVSLGSMENKVKEHLQASMPVGIFIRTVMLPFVQYPPQVQGALDNMQKELAATQVAIQQKKTALEQKQAIETLASAKMTPEAFMQQCLIVTERLAAAGHQISLAWTCVPGSSGLALTGRQP